MGSMGDKDARMHSHSRYSDQPSHPSPPACFTLPPTKSVMDYASGGSLFEYVQQRKRLRESVARWFFQQLVFAVDYCHRKVSGLEPTGDSPASAACCSCRQCAAAASQSAQQWQQVMSSCGCRQCAAAAVAGSAQEQLWQTQTAVLTSVACVHGTMLDHQQQVQQCAVARYPFF